MTRFEQLAPRTSTQGSSELRGTIAGEDAFRLYDTFGFPIDLTELMARERGYVVDISGFETALTAQRERSQEERRSRKLSVDVDELADASAWTHRGNGESQRFVGYDTVEIETLVTAVRPAGEGRVAVMLHETPFYAESGGQVSDHGEIVGASWRVDVDDVKRVDGRIAAIGVVTGTVAFERAVARVPALRRRDTERNHTGTHLLHAALRHTLGEHVHQAGSVVEPDRLRFDFTHHGPVGGALLEGVEQWVNDAIWRGVDVQTREMPHAEAVALRAMALFGEKYGAIVRVVEIAGLSTELCGGCHVRNTGQIGLFRVVSEHGVSAGVRRIVAVTGPKAFALMRGRERALDALGERLKVNVQSAGPEAIAKRVDTLLSEKRALEKRLEEALRGGASPNAGSVRSVSEGALGSSGGRPLTESAQMVGGYRLLRAAVQAPDLRTLQTLGDAVRAELPAGVGVLGATFDEGKASLLIVVGDALREKGVSAADLVKALAERVGVRGGGKAHMAQAGVTPEALEGVLDTAREIARDLLERTA